jgi:hypothetical protein
MVGAEAQWILVEAGEAHEGQAHQAGGDHGDGGALEGRGHVGAVQALADAGKKDEDEGEADRTAEAEEQGFEQVVVQGDVEQGDAEHGAVGGDQRQVDAEHLVQHRAGLLDDQLGDLHDGGDDDDEGQGAQVVDARGDQHVVVHKVAGAAAQGEHEGGCRAHADGRVEFLGDAHEGAQAEDADQDDVVHQNGAENHEKVAGHISRTGEGQGPDYPVPAGWCSSLLASGGIPVLNIRRSRGFRQRPREQGPGRGRSGRCRSGPASRRHRVWRGPGGRRRHRRQR